MANSPTWTLTQPLDMFHQALEAAGIPFAGLALVQPADFYPPDSHVVKHADGLFIDISYLSEATEAEIHQGDEIVATLDLSPKRVRLIWHVYEDITLLKTPQVAQIQADLKADGGAKIRSMRPPHDAIMLVLDFNAQGPGDKHDIYSRLAATYVQQNVHYLERPEFDPTINIPGWEVIPEDEINTGEIIPPPPYIIPLPIIPPVEGETLPGGPPPGQGETLPEPGPEPKS